MTASPQASRGTARFPFSAVVGQADLRLALLLNAVHPRIGGVLVRGEKGTAKSTVVRALASLLPALDVVPDCRFNCSPARPDAHCPDGPHATAETLWRDANLVELPVGATEDRLIGSLDVERALTEGVRAYQPGLLAAAHRGVLYVDEVNLLHDHLVDVLLDAAGMGRSHVEREGVSISHAASFVLVGTMNPEEGELRPQLLDRFGLTVQVNADKEVQTRTEVVRRRLAFEADPEGFAAEWVGEDVRLAERIADARARVEHVVLPDSEVRRIAALCASFDVDGMRADLVLARTAVAHAAWRGADEVAATDVETAAKLVLPHRRRRDPFDEPGMDEDQLQQALDDAAEHAAEDSDQQHGPDSDDADSDDAGSDEDPDDDPNGGGPGGPSGGPDDGPDDGGPDDGPGGGQAPPEDGQRPEPSSGQSETDQDNSESSGNAPEQRQAPAPTSEFRARLLEIPGMGEGAPGRRSRARSRIGRGVRASRTEGHGVHLSSTVLAAAPHQRARGRSGTGLVVRNEDVRHTVREGRESNLVLFAVDASGSMAARERMSAVSGAVLSLLRDAYQRRDKVGVISFRGAAAEVALPPTSSVDVAATRMRQLRTGGRTPLADGLLRAHKVVETERNRDAQRRPLLVLLTDGKATVPADSATAPTSSRERTRQASADALRAAGKLAERSVASVVVDCEQGMVRVGLAAQLATALGAPALRLEELSADAVAGVVRAAQQPACAA